MASVILESLPQSKVVLINLAKSLLVDFVCLRKAFPHLKIALVRTRKELEESLFNEEIRATILVANDSDILMGCKFSLAINIESMMEMDPPEIERYFNILRSASDNEMPFYCCNLEKKLFSGGKGSSCFYDYPWAEDDKIILHETCPWTRIRYGNTFPFIFKREADLHRLTILKQS